MSQFVFKPLTKPSQYICARCLRLQSANRGVRRVSTTTLPAGGKDSNILSVLEKRGYVNQIAGDRNALDRLLRKKKVGFYVGVDPTAPSLHLGHLLPIMVLFWTALFGHSAVSLIGGGTARVGDPSGRLTSRVKTAENVHSENASAMFEQTSALWKNAIRYAQRHGHKDTQIGNHRLLDNGQWLDQLNVLDFLKALGHGMRLGPMLGRDTVKNKMEKGDGMSFSEFTYPLLQAWDWWHMYNTMGVQIQIGGSDQYGNIVAGMDAVKYIAQTHEKVASRERWLDAEGKLIDELAPMGLTVPLLTTSSGEKFGKSAGNAIWLDRNLTSPFDLYGFLLRSSDTDVHKYLSLFTFLPMPYIEAVMIEHLLDPGKRIAQHLLASEVLELVHGPEEAVKTRLQHQSLRNPSLASLSNPASPSSESDAAQAIADHTTILPKSLVRNTPFARILYHAGLVSTRSEGARLIAKGGAYIASNTSCDGDNDLTWTQITDQKPEDIATLKADGSLMLRIGKWKVRVVETVDDDVFDREGLEAPGWIEWKEVQAAS